MWVCFSVTVSSYLHSIRVFSEIEAEGFSSISDTKLSGGDY
jgi:hypothetical protein